MKATKAVVYGSASCGILFLLDILSSATISKLLGLLHIAPNIVMWGVIVVWGLALRALNRLDRKAHFSTFLCAKIVLIVPHLYASINESQPSAARYHHDVVVSTWWAVGIMVLTAFALDLVDKFDETRAEARIRS